MQQTMIVSSNNQPSVTPRDNAIVVATPLDAIMRLEKQEHPHHRIGTVVLAGSFASNHELATFLDEFYPSVRVECEV
jgi:hypothetical protein